MGRLPGYWGNHPGSLPVYETVMMNGGTMSSCRLPAALALAGAVATGGCVVSLDSQGHTAREERRFDVSGAPDVRVTTFDGSIQVRSWDRAEVLIEIEKRAPTEEALADIEVVAEQDGNTIQVEVRRPSGSDSYLGIGVHTSRSARIIATVPRRSDLVLRSGDGSIRVDRVNGRAELRTGDGSVRASELSGEVVVHTGDGSVTLQDVEGELDVETGDGGVSASGVLRVVRLRTNDGSVTVRGDEGSAMSDDWSITTGDGSVAVYLPEAFAAELDAHTGDGRITSDLDVAMVVSGKLDRRTLKGRVGEGGRVLKVRSGDGSIRFRVS